MCWVHSLEAVRTAIDDPQTGSQTIMDAEFENPDGEESGPLVIADEKFACRVFAREGVSFNNQ